MDTPTGSIVKKFAELDNSEFRDEVYKLWEAGRHVVDTIVEQVENGAIEPLQGLGIIGCTTSQLYAYNAFHGQATQVDMLSALEPARR